MYTLQITACALPFHCYTHVLHVDKFRSNYSYFYLNTHLRIIYQIYSPELKRLKSIDF